MGNEIEPLHVGDSKDFCFDLDGDSVSGWVCTINVKKYPADTTLLTRIITADGDTWPGFLTATETTALGVGAFRLIGKLVKSATDEQRTAAQRYRFNLAPAFAD